jgi:hypothetical protein
MKTEQRCDARREELDMDKTYEIRLRSKRDPFRISAHTMEEKDGWFEFKDPAGQIVGRYRAEDVHGYQIVDDEPTDFVEGSF